MTSEDLIEKVIDVATDVYKKNSRGSPEARRLDRHEPITVDGYQFSYWREYASYKMCELICDTIPELEKGTDIRLLLDGNDSTIEVTLTDHQQEKLNRNLYLLLEKNGYL
ncbi:MAG: hypothetical protein IJ772_05330 [Bacilli bacterium]|nr:hypothetical protein [Bacilli bacterium]